MQFVHRERRQTPRARRGSEESWPGAEQTPHRLPPRRTPARIRVRPRRPLSHGRRPARGRLPAHGRHPGHGRPPGQRRGPPARLSSGQAAAPPRCLSRLDRVRSPAHGRPGRDRSLFPAPRSVPGRAGAQGSYLPRRLPQPDPSHPLSRGQADRSASRRALDANPCSDRAARLVDPRNRPQERDAFPGNHPNPALDAHQAEPGNHPNPAPDAHQAEPGSHPNPAPDAHQAGPGNHPNPAPDHPAGPGNHPNPGRGDHQLLGQGIRPPGRAPCPLLGADRSDRLFPGLERTRLAAGSVPVQAGKREPTPVQPAAQPAPCGRSERHAQAGPAGRFPALHRGRCFLPVAVQRRACCRPSRLRGRARLGYARPADRARPEALPRRMPVRAAWLERDPCRVGIVVRDRPACRPSAGRRAYRKGSLAPPDAPAGCRERRARREG